MVVDARGLGYYQIFLQMQEAVPKHYDGLEPLMVFVDAYESQKVQLIREFALILFKCEIEMAEANGYYILKILIDCPLFGNFGGSTSHA